MVEFSVMVSLTIVVAQMCKKLGLSIDFLPLLHLCLAIILALVFLNELIILNRIQQGILIGLSASGVYDMGMCIKKV